jgi:hypothetical protein
MSRGYALEQPAVNAVSIEKHDAQREGRRCRHAACSRQRRGAKF